MKHLFELLAADKQSEAARARRRAYPIHMYTGRNGAGKSLCAIYDTLPDLDAGVPVLSTVRLLDYSNPRPCDDPLCEDPFHGRADHLAAHPSYVPFTSWTQLLEWRRGPVLMDEITGVADSNESAAMPTAAANKLAQLRRDDCSVRITGLNFIRANKRIREAVNAVTRCQSFLPVTAYHEDGTEKMWKQRRFAKWTTYDAQSLPVDDHTEGAYEKADVLVRGRHWIPGSPAITAYDTNAPVLMVGSVTDAGRCAHCAGTRRAPECNCPDYVASKLASKATAKALSSDTAVLTLDQAGDSCACPPDPAPTRRSRSARPQGRRTEDGRTAAGLAPVGGDA